jgi:choline kinase
MIGMVLAAGAGRRLRPYTDTLPKALVPVDGDTTILDIALRNLAAVDLRDVVVVVGYQAGAVEERKAALEKRYGVELTLAFNDKAEEWNNAYSFWTARKHLTDGVLMVNGDTVHPVSVEEMKVTVDSGGALQRITKLMDPAEAYGEYIGASLIESHAVDALADALEATWRKDPQLYYEDGYQEMVDRGEKIGLAPIPADVSWVEVDDHRDLERAREIACRY